MEDNRAPSILEFGTANDLYTNAAEVRDEAISWLITRQYTRLYMPGGLTYYYPQAPQPITRPITILGDGPSATAHLRGYDGGGAIFQVASNDVCIEGHTVKAALKPNGQPSSAGAGIMYAATLAQGIPGCRVSDVEISADNGCSWSYPFWMVGWQNYDQTKPPEQQGAVGARGLHLRNVRMFGGVNPYGASARFTDGIECSWIGGGTESGGIYIESEMPVPTAYMKFDLNAISGKLTFGSGLYCGIRANVIAGDMILQNSNYCVVETNRVGGQRYVSWNGTNKLIVHSD